MIKAVFFDIDGTLVSFKTHKVPQSTVDALSELRQKGIKVIIATARLLKQIDNLGDLQFDGMITVNGSYCIDTQNNVIAEHFIPKTDLESLVDYEKNILHFSYAFLTDAGTFVNCIDDKVKQISELTNSPYPTACDLSDMVNEKVFQLKLYVDKETELKIMSETLQNCESSRWHENFANVNVGGINKSVGVDEFLKYYNISKSETMAFGDGGNDIEMLQHAGIGIAMGNANDEVKDIADYVTTSVDEDGIANALCHFGLIDTK